MINTIYYLPIDDKLTDLFYALLPLVSEKRREKISKYHFDIDKKLSLYSEVIVRKSAIDILGIKNSEIVFENNDFGKPYIVGQSDFHFNISHTHSAILVGISTESIGVDIERITKSEINIAKRFFTEDEYNYIVKSEYEKDIRFYEVWTKKEAYVKYIGKGLNIKLSSFSSLSCNFSKHIKTLSYENYIISIYNNHHEYMGMNIIKENQISLYYSKINKRRFLYENKITNSYSNS